jgi:hypothetical protein
VAVELFDSESGRSIGSITDAQFQGLVDALEEESPTDRDYYISTDTIDMLEQDGADPAVLSLLRAAVGAREGAEIRWRRR